MARFSLLRSRAQLAFDVSIAALAVACGSTGYYQVTNEDAPAKEKRLQREDEWRRARQQKRDEYAQAYAKQALEELAKGYEGHAETLQKKRDEMLKLQNEIKALSTRLQSQTQAVNVQVEKLKVILRVKRGVQATVQERHRKLLEEVEDLKRQLKDKEELQARSSTINEQVVQDKDESLKSQVDQA